MKMYRLTIEEIVKLLSREMGRHEKFNPVQDINGDWFISDIEHEITGLGTEAEFEEPITEDLI